MTTRLCKLSERQHTAPLVYSCQHPFVRALQILCKQNDEDFPISDNAIASINGHSSYPAMKVCMDMFVLAGDLPSRQPGHPHDRGRSPIGDTAQDRLRSGQ